MTGSSFRNAVFLSNKYLKTKLNPKVPKPHAARNQNTTHRAILWATSSVLKKNIPQTRQIPIPLRETPWEIKVFSLIKKPQEQWQKMKNIKASLKNSSMRCVLSEYLADFSLTTSNFFYFSLSWIFYEAIFRKA